MANGIEDEDVVVRVLAQVMTRDEGSGGWVPVKRGGMAHVSVTRRPSEEQAGKNNFLILGVLDKELILNCLIHRNFIYYKVLPTFHHWQSGQNRYGLTFTTAADGRHFDSGVRKAVEELLEDLGEGDVFMSLELPMERSGVAFSPCTAYGAAAVVSSLVLKPSTDSSSGGTIHSHHPSAIIPSSQVVNNNNITGSPPNNNIQSHHQRSSCSQAAADRYSDPESDPYHPISKQPMPTVDSLGLAAKFPYLHRLSDPVIPSGGGMVSPSNFRYQKDSSSSSGTGGRLSHPKEEPGWDADAPKKTSPCLSGGARSGGRRLKCKYCGQDFDPSWNRKGDCPLAPDPIRRTIDTITCVGCASCLQYHCSNPSANNGVQDEPHPCSCRPRDSTGGWPRVLALGLLSIVAPCLWCYWPLHVCHAVGLFQCCSCLCCGGKMGQHQSS